MVSCLFSPNFVKQRPSSTWPATLRQQAESTAVVPEMCFLPGRILKPATGKRCLLSAGKGLQGDGFVPGSPRTSWLGPQGNAAKAAGSSVLANLQHPCAGTWPCHCCLCCPHLLLSRPASSPCKSGPCLSALCLPFLSKFLQRFSWKGLVFPQRSFRQLERPWGCNLPWGFCFSPAR